MARKTKRKHRDNKATKAKRAKQVKTRPATVTLPSSSMLPVVDLR